MSEQKLTGYPSIDKPWLKYYSKEAISTPLLEATLYEYVYQLNQDNLEKVAINYYGKTISYGQLFHNISIVAGALERMGVTEGDIVTACMINSPEMVELIFALNKIGAVVNSIYGVSSEKEIERYISDNLEPVYCPVSYHFVNKFPLTKVDKVDYRALEQKAERLAWKSTKMKKR